MAREYYFADLVLTATSAARLTAAAHLVNLSVQGYALQAVAAYCKSKGFPVCAPTVKRRIVPDMRTVLRRTLYLPESWRGALTGVMLREGMELQAVLRVSVMTRLEHETRESRITSQCRNPAATGPCQANRASADARPVALRN